MIFDRCYFCFQDLPSRKFGVLRRYDYRGLPSDLVEILQRNVRDGFPACESCARLMRAKDPTGMEERAAFYKPTDADSKDEQIRKMSFWLSALLNQRIFWLGCATNLGDTVSIYEHVDRSYRVQFDLLSAGVPGAGYAKFSNGVELWCAPFGNTMLLEELRSANRGRGEAANVMQLVVASADVHEVTLVGNVESHPVDGATDVLSDEQLYAWYGTLGFVRDGSSSVSIQRPPRISVTIGERKAAYAAALSALGGRRS